MLRAIRTIFPALRVVNLVDAWREDRLELGSAGVVFAPHGGNIGNIIFAPAGTILVEFLPLLKYHHTPPSAAERNVGLTTKNPRPCYFGLSLGLGFNYFSVEPSVFDFDSGGMVVPVDRVTETSKAVRALMDARPRRIDWWEYNTTQGIWATRDAPAAPQSMGSGNERHFCAGAVDRACYERGWPRCCFGGSTCLGRRPDCDGIGGTT